MTARIQPAIERLQYHAALVAGVQSAPDNLTLAADNNSVSALSYLASGEFDLESAGVQKDLVTLITRFELSGPAIEDLERKAEGMPEDFIDRVRADSTLNSTVTTIVYPIQLAVARIVENEARKLILQFTIQVKQRP